MKGARPPPATAAATAAPSAAASMSSITIDFFFLRRQCASKCIPVNGFLCRCRVTYHTDANELFQVTRDLLFTSHTICKVPSFFHCICLSVCVCVCGHLHLPFCQSGQWLAKLLLLLMLLLLLHVRKYFRRRSPGG